MLRQLLTNGNERKDSLRQDGYYSASPTSFLIKSSQTEGTDVFFTSMPPSLPFDQDATAKTDFTFSPPYSVELCANEVVMKNDNGQKSLAVVSNMPPNNRCVQQTSASSLVMKYPPENLNGHISGTTELFSSTFAMLSADGVVPETEWSSQQQSEQRPIPIMYALNAGQGQSTEFNQPYVQQTVQVSTHCYGQHPRFQQYITTGDNVNVQQSQADQLLYYQPQSSESGNPQNLNTNSCPNEGGVYNANSERVLQSSYFQGFQEIARVPVSSETNSGRNTPLAENENEADERVMCMACRGVYPSRRSLTGHIGRNEKCREIIGRNYLDQLGGCADKVSVSGSPAGTVGPAETISPICPYCDRFISHYKGNIRRHINQCLKSDRSKTRKLSSRKQENGLVAKGYSSNFDSCYDGYQPHMLATASGEVQWDNPSRISNACTVSQPSPQTPHAKDGKNNDDPYLCSVCEFVTVYKGNMKRHLSTCHSITEDDLGEGGLDSLRASRRSGDLHSRIGKVSRGRRPKSVQLQDECRKKAKLELLKCYSPVMSEIPTTQVDMKSPASSSGNLIEGFGDSSSNSSSSVQEHFRVDSECQSQSIIMNDLPNIVETGSSGNSNVYTSQQQLQHQQTCDISNSDLCIPNAVYSVDNNSLVDGLNQHTGTTTSTSNIDEIINAVASNQLGSVANKSTKQGRASKSGGRRSVIPKAVCNMEEVRDYWEAERLSSGSSSLPAVYFARSRNSQFSAISSQTSTSTAGSPYQQ